MFRGGGSGNCYSTLSAGTAHDIVASRRPTDPRYALEFWPLGNADTCRGHVRTRAVRPFSFRVAAFGGARHPFGFLGTGTSAAVVDIRSTADDPRGIPASKRWPYRTFDEQEEDSRDLFPSYGKASSFSGTGTLVPRCRPEKRRAFCQGAGAAWRDPLSISAAVGVATDGRRLKDMELDG